MTQYKYQTNPALLIEGELGLNASNQLVTEDELGVVHVLGNVPSTTPVSTLAQTYAEDLMDISGAQTLGSGFIFLNGTSLDSTGVGTYEFEEAGGRVYGLYGRTDGLNQQVYFSGASNNRATLQYTTVPYQPPFLNGDWQAAAVVGSDLQGFVLVLRSVSAPQTPYRYIYVRHHQSLINVNGHDYMEITDAVNHYLPTWNLTGGGLPNIMRVGQFFFMAGADWQQGSYFFGGWNATDAFTQVPITGTVTPYNPQRMTLTTSQWPGRDATGETLNLFGNSGQSDKSVFKIYDRNTGQLYDSAFFNTPEPILAGWSTNVPAILEGEVDSGGVVRMAIGCICYPGALNALSPYQLVVYSVTFAPTAGPAGAYTAGTLTYNDVGQNGSDAYHQQPWPFIMGVNPNNAAPREDLQSDPANPISCVDKLPVCSYYTGCASRWSTTMNNHWYYSGVHTLVGTGNAQNIRGVANSGSQKGGLGAAQANKLASIFPMFNVAQRVNFDPTTGAPMAPSIVIPSGKMVESYFGHMIAPDKVLSAAVDYRSQQLWVVSQVPNGSNITDAQYSRFGQVVPGFNSRVAEYNVNLPSPQTTHSTWGAVWVNGMGNIRAPQNFMFPTICDRTDTTQFNPNGKQALYGQWSGPVNGVMQPPPAGVRYADNILDQLRALKPNAVSAAQAFSPNTGTDGIFFIEVVPVLNSAGNVAYGLGVQWTGGAQTPQPLTQANFFTTPMGIDAQGRLSLTNTSSVTMLQQVQANTIANIGTSGGNDAWYGKLWLVYPSDGTTLVSWTPAVGVNTAGDTLTAPTVFVLNGAGQKVGGANGSIRSSSRSGGSCSAQHQGLVIEPYRDGVAFPQVDTPISRYATSTVNVVDDFHASWTAALNNPSNLISGTLNSYNLAEMIVMQAINNQFLLQIGSINGRMNHKEYSLPSSFFDLTSYAVGTYYLYLTDTGSGGVQLQVDAAQRPESATNMYFGKFDRTSTGFANQTSVGEVTRFGTARLIAGSSGSPIQGSQIRIGPHAG